MKEIKKERTVYDIYYEAVDGTQFNSKEECQKYENTAKAVLRERFKKLVLKATTEYSFFGIGSDDDKLFIVKMETEADRDTVLQLYYNDNSWVLNGDAMSISLKERAFNMVTKAFTENDILFVGENYDGDIYLINTRAAFIEKLHNIDHKEQ